MNWFLESIAPEFKNKYFIHSTKLSVYSSEWEGLASTLNTITAIEINIGLNIFYPKREEKYFRFIKLSKDSKNGFLFFKNILKNVFLFFKNILKMFLSKNI